MQECPVWGSGFRSPYVEFCRQKNHRILLLSSFVHGTQGGNGLIQTLLNNQGFGVCLPI